MESWENKIMADKLNSLQGFPADYAPDLSSKWEIIEAGLPQKKKRRIAPMLMRWSVAAAILVSFYLVWINTNEKANDTTVVLPFHQNIPDNSLIFTPQKQEPQAEVAVVTIDESKNTDKKVSIPHHQPANTLVINSTSKKPGQQNEEMQNADQAKPEVKLPIQIDIVSQQKADTVLNNDALATASTVEKIKPAKKKIYQRDFNDGALVMDTIFSPYGTQHFGIRLLPFSKKVNESSEQPSRRLQWKTSL